MLYLKRKSKKENRMEFVAEDGKRIVITSKSDPRCVSLLDTYTKNAEVPLRRIL